MTELNDKTLKLMSLIEKEDKLKNLKIFPKSRYGLYGERYYTNPIYDDEFNPTKMTYKLYDNYILATTKIYEKKLKLLTLTNVIIKIDDTSYFPLSLPRSELREELLILFAENEIRTTEELTISWDSTLEIKVVNLKKELPRYWDDRMDIVRQVFETPIDFIKYRPSKKQRPCFPLYIPQEKTAKAFIQMHNATAYTFYYNALIYHVAFSSGLFGQTSINKIVADIEQIRALLPVNLTIDKLLAISKNSVHKIDKIRRKLLFTYNIEKLNALHSHPDNKKAIKHQRINIPIKLLPHIFKANSFGKNGTAYFLAVIFAQRATNLKINYKPSTLVKLANINTKRGINYTLQALNKPLNYLKEIGLIKEFHLITKEIYKDDSAIEIKLTPLKDVKL